jgi:predicted aspartyl protease
MNQGAIAHGSRYQALSGYKDQEWDQGSSNEFLLSNLSFQSLSSSSPMLSQKNSKKSQKIGQVHFSSAFSTFDESPTFVKIVFSQDDKKIESYAFLDQGAQGMLVNPHVIKMFDTQPVTQPVKLHFMDGTSAKNPVVIESVVGKLQIGNHEEFTEFGITETCTYPFVLGGGWQKFHGISLDHKEGHIHFGRDCENHGVP